MPNVELKDATRIRVKALKDDGKLVDAYRVIFDEIRASPDIGAGVKYFFEGAAATNSAWLVNLIAPFGHVDAAIEDLRKTALAGTTFRMHRRGSTGQMMVHAIERDAAPTASHSPDRVR
jgi:hypothetical protein